MQDTYVENARLLGMQLQETNERQDTTYGTGQMCRKSSKRATNALSGVDQGCPEAAGELSRWTRTALVKTWSVQRNSVQRCRASDSR